MLVGGVTPPLFFTFTHCLLIGSSILRNQNCIEVLKKYCLHTQHILWTTTRLLLWSSCRKCWLKAYSMLGISPLFNSCSSTERVMSVDCARYPAVLLRDSSAYFSSLFWFYATFTVCFSVTALISLVPSSRQLVSTSKLWSTPCRLPPVASVGNTHGNRGSKQLPEPTVVFFINQPQGSVISPFWRRRRHTT